MIFLQSEMCYGRCGPMEADRWARDGGEGYQEVFNILSGFMYELELCNCRVLCQHASDPSDLFVKVKFPDPQTNQCRIPRPLGAGGNDIGHDLW